MNFRKQINVEVEDNFYVLDYTSKDAVFIEISGQDLLSAIALFINTKREMEENND